MRISVKGRHMSISDDVREHVDKRCRKIDRQVSELAELEVELSHERNPSIADCYVAEATLHLKGVTLRARESSGELMHAINCCCDDLSVQVKRHRDKRRKRREARSARVDEPVAPPEVPGVEPVGDRVGGPVAEDISSAA